MTTPHQRSHLWTNLLGGFTAILGIVVFSIVYYFAKLGINLDGLYWLSTCFLFSSYSGLLFMEKRKELVSVLYMLSFVFFFCCFTFSLLDWLFLDKLRMSKVYVALIIVAILTLLTFAYKWIIYYFYRPKSPK